MRRLDVKVYAPQCLPFAKLYFTGNDYFNRSMRLLAKKMRMQLNDKGLFSLRDEARWKYHKEGKTWVREPPSLDAVISHECKCEEDIFKALKIEYCKPRDRLVYGTAAQLKEGGVGE